ncbi:MAG: ribbon-helix-helix protein, CopG family [Planctomycetes bacterium]|nr:ribbon-helix-helix protein, CopG family [Planctomycetota bacterium]
MTTVTIRIPEELLTQLQKLCDQQHRSTSDVIRESLRRYIDAEQLRLIREMTHPQAEARGFLTDDDVFKVVS